ncbi:PH domain-containing protein [Ferrimonas balearica]|uniref:PH domain-containing protein n=1 Tax=Ferrimonas balearica TaxID=44012 RepID=UPI001C96B577|nr:PH domain-containing protein [Ferrimonas balearica]MBY6223068.1 PH domain-containing protein [Ferrimonas balearica]
MGLLDGLMGNATEVNAAELQDELSPILASQEQVQLAYRVVRDMFVFTNKRLLLIDKQGVTGKKVEYHSIPFKSITHFLVETSGRFDLDAELKVWISGQSEPLTRELKKGTDVVGIQRAIAELVLG